MNSDCTLLVKKIPSIIFASLLKDDQKQSDAEIRTAICMWLLVPLDFFLKPDAKTQSGIQIDSFLYSWMKLFLSFLDSLFCLPTELKEEVGWAAVGRSAARPGWRARRDNGLFHSRRRKKRDARRRLTKGYQSSAGSRYRRRNEGPSSNLMQTASVWKCVKHACLQNLLSPKTHPHQ